ncbi:MAG: DUF167 family protein [Alphaproteobacteria bacterium]|nr:DUF167 family protein [Alphaproteobacteria bacterium]
MGISANKGDDVSKQRSLFDTIPTLPNEASTQPCRATKEGVELFVRATPKAAKERIDSVTLDADSRSYLKVYVTAAPEDNQANKAVIALLAKKLSLPKSCISLKSGGTHRLKCFSLEGISLDEVVAALRV